MSRPKVSVVVPIYNTEAYLPKCLDSLINQTLGDIEVLCVDDCGKDGSMAIAEEYAQRDSRIKLIRNEANMGSGGARNAGTIAATGEYLTYVDSDDWLMPDMLEKEYAAVSGNGLDSVWIKFWQYYEETDSMERSRDSNSFRSGFIDVSYPEHAGITWAPWSLMVRTDFVQKNRILFPVRRVFEDVEFFFKFHALSPRTYLLDEHLYVYRLARKGSIIDGISSGRARCEDCCDVGEDCFRFLEEHGIFERHGGNLLDMLAKKIDPLVTSKHYKERMIVRGKEMLRNIGFPERYSAFRNNYGYALFDALAGSAADPSRYKYYKPLSLLNQLNPFSEHRKRMKARIRVNYRCR